MPAELAIRTNETRLSLTGSLTADALPRALSALRLPQGNAVQVDLTQTTAYDGAGIAFLTLVQSRIEASGASCIWEGLPADVSHQIAAYRKAEQSVQPAEAPLPQGIHETLGRWSHALWVECLSTLAYIGELSAYSLQALRHPHLIRKDDFWLTFQRAGVNAVPVVMLIGFLLGLILAFQAAIPMKMFGAEIYVAGLVGISVVRELGPLITAILLTGRSGSAFAAELGTMKVNEEIDALETMGLHPVRFLAIPRVLAGTLAMPLLALFGSLAALFGGWVVMVSMGYPLAVYMGQLESFVTFGDLLGGLVKSFFFGLIVAAVGCRCGLEAGRDAGAVGQSTTRSVVTGIVMIAVADGLFAVLFYIMGW